MEQAEKIKFDRAELAKYAEKSGIKFVVLFGSQAKGRAREDSDFDIAVFLKNNRSIFENLDNYSEMLNELSKVLDSKNKRVDLTDLNRANILLRHEVISNGVLLYGDDDEYEQYKAFAFRDYVDSSPLFALEELLIRKRQESIRESIFSK